MDNIKIKKIWTDADFYQVEIIFITKEIQCKTITYIVNDEIEKLSSYIMNYVKNPNNNFNWEIGEKGSEHSPSIIIKSININKNGYVTLDIFCDVYSPFGNNYCCYFTLESELGLLQVFAEDIIKLNAAGVDTSIQILQ